MARPVTLFMGQWADLALEELAEKARDWGYGDVESPRFFAHLEIDRARESASRRLNSSERNRIAPPSVGQDSQDFEGRGEGLADTGGGSSERGESTAISNTPAAASSDGRGGGSSEGDGGAGGTGGSTGGSEEGGEDGDDDPPPSCGKAQLSPTASNVILQERLRQASASFNSTLAFAMMGGCTILFGIFLVVYVGNLPAGVITTVVGAITEVISPLAKLNKESNDRLDDVAREFANCLSD